MKRFFTILAAAFALASCTQDVAENIEINAEKPTYYASFADAEAESRTYLDENLKLLWHNDDRISLFATTTYNEEYAFVGTTGSNSGAFEAVDNDSWVTGNPISTPYAVYPYNENNALSNSEVLTIHFPAEQTYMENSFGRGANTMVAAAESAESKLLPFRNAGGYLMLKLYGEGAVKSIELKGNNEEILSGAATAEAKYGYLPAITMGTEGGQTITLNCEEAVTLGATEAEATVFWLVVPPITFEKGFTITVTDAEGGTFVQATSKEVIIERNEIKSMAPLEVIIENPENPTPSVPEIPNNEIWYTATAKVEPGEDAQFGANYLSSAWNETTGEGVLFFDGDVTIIERNAFWYSEDLKSIILPQSVNSVSGGAFEGLRNLSKFEGKFASEDGHCLIVDGTLVSIACAGLSEYRLPDNIDSIADYGCSCMWFNGFERLIIPGSVKTLGCCACAESWNIKEFVLEEGIEEIGGDAFFGASGISSISFPSTITKIGSYAIGGVEDLSLYFYSIMPPAIESNSFNSNYIKNIFITAKAIPNYISYVDYNDEQYENWFNLLPYIKGSIESPEFNNSSEIDNNEIRYQTYDGYICPPFFSDESDWGANIVAHRYNDTLGCWVIQFDDEVEQVCDNAFFHPSGRQSRLNNITLPNSITRIGKQAFVINNLESVTIPENVTIIDDDAFNEIGDLSVIYCKPIVPPTIGNYAFHKWDGCDLNIYVPAQSEVDYKRKWLDLSPYIYPYNFE